jgi:hypothetical protein
MKKPASKIYRTTNWSSYNQTLIKQGNISIWFDRQTKWHAQPQAKHGRNQTYLIEQFSAGRLEREVLQAIQLVFMHLCLL